MTKKKKKEKKLSTTITDFLEPLEASMNKEITFIRNNDWTDVEDRKKRETQLKLHAKLTDRGLKHAEKLQNLAEEDLDHPRLKKVFKTYFEMFEIFEKRYYLYTENEDWTKYLEKNLSEAEMKQELQLQSEALKHITTFKETARKINIDNNKKTINLPILNNQPIPLVMREVVEQRYPEIKNYDYE